MSEEWRVEATYRAGDKVLDVPARQFTSREEAEDWRDTLINTPTVVAVHLVAVDIDLDGQVEPPRSIAEKVLRALKVKG